MSVTSILASRPVALAKIHLAAAHRLAVLHELEEGIDNHFTVTVPVATASTSSCRSDCIGPRRAPAT